MDFNSVLIGSEKPDRLREYYGKLFGKPAMEEQGFAGWQVGTGWITVGPHDQVTGKNPQPGRVLLNIESGDVKGDFEKFRDAGAIVVQEPYNPGGESEMWIATFADPDDNYLQLMSSM